MIPLIQKPCVCEWCLYVPELMSGRVKDSVHGVGVSDTFSMRMKRSLAASAARGPHSIQPGTQFKKLVETLLISKTETCLCTELEQEMNDLGSAGCMVNRENLITRINHNKESLSIGTLIRSGIQYLSSISSYPFIQVGAPIESLFDEAVRRSDSMSLLVPPATVYSGQSIQAPQTETGPRLGCCGGGKPIPKE